MSEVSVIVPMYNAERYLRRCLDSILSQTFTEFELLLIDDGSTDKTDVIAKEYCERDSRVRYIRQENAGPDYARKRGIEEATGEYLMFVDADDYIRIDMIQNLYRELKEHHADFVCSQMMRVDTVGKKWNDCNMKESALESHSVRENLYHFFVTRYISGSYDTKLFEKKLLKDYKFLKESVIGEDVSVILYILQHAKCVRILKEAYYFYFWNENSISHSGYTKRHKISLQNYIQVKESLLAKGYIEPEVICGFFAEYEMAAATAMSRSWYFDKETIAILKNDLRKSMKEILKNRHTSFYMKVCIVMFRYCPYLFMGIYRMIYLMTGR
ncbi:MAG: glycosyltransferase family 2 protein [Lachnospiraceae bacterium]